MRTSLRSVRRRLLMLPACAAVLAATLTWAAPEGDQKKTGSETEAVAVPADLPADAVDLTDKVEVTVNGTLRSSSRTAHSTTVTVKNISEEDLHGPLVVIIDELGIDGLELTKADGKLSDDRPYVEIVAKGSELKAGKSLTAQRLSFKTEKSLTGEERGKFDPQVRVCQLDETKKTAAADQDDTGKIPGKSYTQKEFDQVASIQDKWTVRLIQEGKREVYGTAIAENANGDLVVKVYTQRSGTDDLVPDTIDEIPVEIQPVGQIFQPGPVQTDTVYTAGKPHKAARGNQDDYAATADPQGTGQPISPIIPPTLFFNRPVPIGVSISNIDVFIDDGTSCYSGTLGCRCVDALGTQYILTNLHVAGARDETTPAPGRLTGEVGDRIIQPSTGDAVAFCEIDANLPNVIGRVADFQDIEYVDFFSTTFAMNRMDACLVRANSGAVGYLPATPGYTTLVREPSHPYIGMPVQKYGRTTSYTDGTVTAVNMNTLVGPYGSGFGYFIGQIEISTPLPLLEAFGQPGDSGSLIVTKQSRWAEDGQPVGLLFAGGPTGFIDITIANPIVGILNRFGVQVDDGQVGPYQTGGDDQTGVSGTSGTVVPDGPAYP